MRPVVLELRRAASTVCQTRRFSFASFMDEKGLEEFLEEADTAEWNDLEVAARFLWKLCMEAGRFNNFVVGFHTIIVFLQNRRGEIAGQLQAYRDLLDILNSGGPLEAILKWMETNYP